MNDTPLRRFALTLQYDGAAFHGWQLQPSGPTVQGVLEQILERISEAHRRVIGSGRTDAGVHALGQVASVDLPPRWTARELRRALNALLPGEVWVAEARQVPPDFHPRYHALARSYVYRIGTRPDTPSPFRHRWCWDLSEAPPSLETLEPLAALLPGDRSFAPFAKAGQPQRGTRCRVTAARWERWGDEGIQFHITANRFLHHMVRYLVGTQVAVALGERPAGDWTSLVHDPAQGLITSPPAPPQGLFLAHVEYSSEAWDEPADLDPPGGAWHPQGPIPEP